MIVDDSATIRELLRAILAETADSFCECSDGSEVLETYKKCRPDWVLMDFKMKEMDGIEATEEILSSFPDAKIIMVTQFNNPILHERAIRTGAIDFVLKENLIDIERIIHAQKN